MSTSPAYINVPRTHDEYFYLCNPFVCAQQYIPVINKAETIHLSQVNSLSPRFFRYCDLLASFKKNGGVVDDLRAMRAFDIVAQSVADLPFNQVFVECSPLLGLVEVSLSFCNGVDVSVGKSFSSDDGDVLFSLFVDHQLLIVDKKSLNELKKSLQETVGS